jgi:predicted ABC-type ATPase
MTNQKDTQDQEVSRRAAQYVRNNADKIVKKYAGDNFQPDAAPVSVFMAGSPGAGKTEFSKAFIDILEGSDGAANQRVIRIDADRIREDLPGYTGNNSRLFQHATSIAVDKIHDYALEHDENFVLDTTFTGGKYKQNIERSLKRDRDVIIIYVYQDPHEAWAVTKQRERKEGRNIPKSVFIGDFFKAKNNVNEVKDKFGDKVTVNLLQRNIKSDDSDLELNINKIDNHLEIDYTKAQLKKEL